MHACTSRDEKILQRACLVGFQMKQHRIDQQFRYSFATDHGISGSDDPGNESDGCCFFLQIRNTEFVERKGILRHFGMIFYKSGNCCRRQDEWVGQQSFGILAIAKDCKQMNTISQSLFVFIAVACFGFGCGQVSGPQPIQTAETEEATSATAARPVVPPTVSLDGPLIRLDLEGLQPSASADSETTALDAKPVPSTAQSANPIDPKATVARLLAQIAAEKLRIQQLRTASRDETLQTEELAAEGKQPNFAQREQSLRTIIRLAQQIVLKTNQDPQQQSEFDTAIVELADARLNLAIAGDAQQARLLAEDAEELYKRDATSFAAAEAGFKLVQLAQATAQAQAAQDPKWALSFARQARLFSEKFPQETNRAALQLVAAGKMCDTLGLVDEAARCLFLVEERYAETPFAAQIQGQLRRLRLPGQELQEFGGSTLHGGFLNAEELRGQPTLIAFWSSGSLAFREDLQLIEEINTSFGNSLKLVGVNLDRDEQAVEQFLADTSDNWTHLFASDPAKRGLDHPVARHYGVTRVPTYWLIDSDGIVRSISLKPAELRSQLAALKFPRD